MSRPQLQPVSLEPAVPGVPPAAHPGADLKPEAQPPDDLADDTTQIPYRDTVKEEDLSAPRPGNAPLDPSYQGFMQLFGTKTWVKLGGYAKVDAIIDSTKVGNPNMFITSKIPVEGEADYGKDEHFAMHAKQTRLNLELRSPTPIGSLKIYYENDFFGNNTEPSMDYRLRHFYGQVANITVGQTWSTFYDPDSFPDTLDFEGPGVLPVAPSTGTPLHAPAHQEGDVHGVRHRAAQERPEQPARHSRRTESDAGFRRQLALGRQAGPRASRWNPAQPLLR